jgi:hypothetical protein
MCVANLFHSASALTLLDCSPPVHIPLRPVLVHLHDALFSTLLSQPCLHNWFGGWGRHPKPSILHIHVFRDHFMVLDLGHTP